jgi:hypothetical protein
MPFDSTAVTTLTFDCYGTLYQFLLTATHEPNHAIRWT